MGNNRHRAVKAAALVVAVHLVVLSTVMSSARAAAPELPRYRFQPGQHLTYMGEEGAATGSGRFGFNRETDIWVVRENADGTATLLVSQRYVRYSERDGVRSDDHTRVDEYIVDISPAGVIADRAKDTFDVLNRLFPELPRDADAADAGWAFTSGDLRHDVQITERADKKEPWLILVQPTSVLMTMNDRAAFLSYTLDPNRGLIERISSVHQHRSRVVRTGEETLVGVGTIGGEGLALSTLR